MTKDKPYVSNYPPLQEWLRKIEARCQWQVRTGGDKDEPLGFVECYLAPGCKVPFLVVVHAHGNGWEVYTPLADNGIASTLADAERRIGLAP